MKTRLLLLLILSMLSVSIYTKAQHTLTRQANRPRPGDILIQQEVEYVDPGKSGKDIVWNFSKLIPIEKQKGLVTKPLDQIQPGEDITKYLQIATNSDVQVSYLADDSGQVIRGLEPGFINSYNIDGDSLLILNRENPSTRMEFSLPQVLLSYPFTYKNRITSCYSGYGVYGDRLGVKLVGSIDTEADGYGTLILSGSDTIRNVLRVKIVKTELEEKEASYKKENGKERKVKGDSIEALLKLYKKELPTTEIVRWYAEGYRYPILEMIHYYTNLGGNKKTDEVRQAFFYDPIQQEVDYMSSAPVNKSQEPPAMRALSSPQEITHVEQQVALDYNIYPNPVISDLKVDIHCLKQTSVRFSLFTMNNLRIYQSVKETPKGHSAITIPMSSLHKGHYILHIDCGDKSIVEKIIKK